MGKKMGMIISYHAPEKAGKTTFGFTFPKPILHFDFDCGRDRAIWRFPNEAHLIKSIPLPEAPDWSIGSGTATRLWDYFCRVYDQAITDPNIRTIFIDTGTQMWKVDHQEYLENFVKRAKPTRLQLQETEYRVPNDRMRGKILAARNTDKTLVIAHYETPERDERWVEQPDGKVKKESVITGRKLHAGFREMRNLVDMHLYLYLNPTPVQNSPIPLLVPTAVIETPGYAPLNSVGIPIANPTYDKLMNFVNDLRKNPF